MILDNLPEWCEITQDMNNRLTEAKVSLSMASPLLAHFMFACEYKFTEDESIPTAAALVTDDSNLIMINKDFFLKVMCDHAERAFVIMHEIRHIFQNHQGRQMVKGYDHELWNIATDYNINPQCIGAYKDEHGYVHISQRYVKHIKLPSKFKVLYNEEYIGLSSDEIYQLILEENDGDVKKAVEAHGGGGRGEDINSNTPSVMDFVPANQVSNKKKNVIKKTSASAIAATSKNIGESELDLVNTIKASFKPKVDYRDHFTDFVKGSTKEYSTYSKVSRRNQDEDIILPSMYGQDLNIIYGIDSSGSMSKYDYDNASSELYGILNQFEGWELTLLSCDTKANVIGKYRSDEGSSFTDVELALIGGGGTDMNSILDYAYEQEDLGEEINVCVIVSDGYIPKLQIREYSDIKVLLLITDNGNMDYRQSDLTVLYMKDLGE